MISKDGQGIGIRIAANMSESAIISPRLDHIGTILQHFIAQFYPHYYAVTLDMSGDVIMLRTKLVLSMLHRSRLPSLTMHTIPPIWGVILFILLRSKLAENCWKTAGKWRAATPLINDSPTTIVLYWDSPGDPPSQCNLP